MKLFLVVTCMLVSKTLSFAIDQGISSNDDSMTNEATWYFSGDWEEKIVGNLVAGNYLKIVYNGSRLPSRDRRYGQRAWDIFVEYKLNDDDHVYSERMGGPENNMMTEEILLPYGTRHISLWFKHWGYYSSYSYDTDYGKNYDAHVEQPKQTIVFEEDWAEDVYGQLKNGENVNVVYSPKRLGDSVMAQVKFSTQGSIQQYPLKSIPNNYLATTLNVPKDAEEIIIWFYKESTNGNQYDSNYGQNYIFDVSK